MKLVSLKKDQSETIEDAEQTTPAEPEYPYGTCLHLDQDSLEKLGIKEFPEIGTTWQIEAVARVSGMSESAGSHGEHKCLDLQIIKLGLGSKVKTAADRMYPEGDSE